MTNVIEPHYWLLAGGLCTARFILSLNNVILRIKFS